MTITNLCEATFGSPWTVLCLTRKLVKNGNLVASRIDGLMHYSLPQTVTTKAVL
jgi:hypothetical protein